MTLHEAIQARHSVRRYDPTPITDGQATAMRKKIEEVNATAKLHVQLILNEPKAFSGIFAYGKFSGVANYLVMAGAKADDLDERVGYYGEQLVLLAQQLGLNTCWAGLNYRKVANTYQLGKDEKIACYIALGHGATQGVGHKRKTVAQLSNAGSKTPPWFVKGVEAARLAPTAVNQQKFVFEHIEPTSAGNKHKVVARRLFSIIGYTRMDLGIAKLHFEIGAGKDNFEWA